MEGHFPNSIRAGVTFSRTVRLNEYEAPTWALNVLLRGPKAIDFASQPDGADHLLLVDAATTAEWTAGQYVFSVRAVSSGTVLEIESGQVTIQPDIASLADGTDTRVHAQRALDAIEAVLEKRASQDQMRYTINNRELWRTPIADLLALRKYYKSEVRRLKAAQRGNLFGAQVRVSL
jgi:enamine deaminase RidA (YjgF/YER057c/UK114 family)